jgi:hypothetical protein
MLFLIVSLSFARFAFGCVIKVARRMRSRLSLDQFRARLRPGRQLAWLGERRRLQDLFALGMQLKQVVALRRIHSSVSPGEA